MTSLDNTKFFLQFAKAPIQIAEPTGFDAAQFILEQEDGRYGRDIFFSDTEFVFEPTVEINGLTHRFPQLVSSYQTIGFESNVKLIIQVEGTNYVIGQLDFPNAETDLLTYFKCTVIQDTNQAVIKRHSDTQVDIYSALDIYGNEIFPLVPKKILLRPLPLFQESIWDSTPYALEGESLPNTFNFVPIVTEYGIEDTLSPAYGRSTQTVSPDVRDDFIFLDVKTTLTENTFYIEEGNWDVDVFSGQRFDFIIRIGVDFVNFFNDQPGDIIIPVPPNATNFSTSVAVRDLISGEKVWGWFKNTGAIGEDGISMTSARMRFTSTSTDIASVTNGVRLIDVMKQVVLSISGKEVDAPRFEEGGEFYDQFVFTGNDIRQIDKPFTISFEEILEYLPECNIDYEVLENGDIFFGHEDDFYTDNLITLFTADVLQGYKQTFNDKFKINKINYRYSDYEKGKNELQKDSLEGISTEFEMSVPNLMVENTKLIEVGFIRDAFLLEKTRKDNIAVTENSATEDDQEKFILDTIEGEFFQTEKLLLQHVFIEGSDGPFPVTNKLKLISDGTFNWTLLGFGEFEDFVISPGGTNEGVFVIWEVTPTILTLQPYNQAIEYESGFFITEINWMPFVDFANRTDEGFSLITASNPYANLKYAPKRNLVKYWGRYLRTSMMFNTSDIIRNTKYVNGAEIEAVFEGEEFYTTGIQARDIDVSLLAFPTLTPDIAEAEIICPFEVFMNLVEVVRGGSDVPNRRGFIRIVNTLAEDISLHPKKITYNWQELLMTVVGEKRKID